MNWLRGFFEQNTPQSSTRLVGILSFLAATTLAFYMVMADKTGAGQVATLALLYTNACIALGLRKSTEPPT